MAIEKWEEPLGENQKTWYWEAGLFLVNSVSEA